MMSILVVGAGFTGSVLCRRLRSIPGLTVTVWEKSRGAGGRQSTKRDGEHSCDIGAQYLTYRHTDTAFRPYLDELRVTNVVQSLSKDQIVNAPARYDGEDITHYVARNGMNSTSKYFLSGTNVHYSNKVARLLKKDNNQIEVTNTDGRTATFDAVVFTIPAPQLLEIDMEIPNEERDKISGIAFTPRFTLMIVFEEVPPFDWTVKYHDDSIVRCLVWDNVKRNKGSEPTLLVHCQAKYAVTNINTKTKEEAGEELLAAVHKIYPELPRPLKVIPHFWRYGQVYKPYPGTPGFIELGSDPLVLAGGDSFFEMSNLQACARGAELLEGRIRKRFGVPADGDK